MPIRKSYEQANKVWALKKMHIAIGEAVSKERALATLPNYPLIEVLEDEYYKFTKRLAKEKSLLDLLNEGINDEE